MLDWQMTNIICARLKKEGIYLELHFNRMLTGLSICSDVLKLIGIPVSVIWFIFGNVREHLVLFSIVLIFGLMPLIDIFVLWWYGRNVNKDNIDYLVEKIYKRRSSYMLTPSEFDHIDRELVRKILQKDLVE